MIYISNYFSIKLFYKEFQNDFSSSRKLHFEIIPEAEAKHILLNSQWKSIISHRKWSLAIKERTGIHIPHSKNEVAYLEPEKDILLVVYCAGKCIKNLEDKLPSDVELVWVRVKSL